MPASSTKLISGEVMADHQERLASCQASSDTLSGGIRASGVKVVDGLQGGDWAEYLRRLIGHDREFGQAVLVVAQLGIADLVKDGPRHLAELAELTRTHEPSLYRVASVHHA